MLKKSRNRPNLSDETLIVRGGKMKNLDYLRKRASEDSERTQKYEILYGLSVFGKNGASLGQVIKIAELRHDFLRTSTAGQIRAAGFRIVPTGKEPHHTVDLCGEPTDEVLSNLIECFNPAEENKWYEE